MTVPVTPVSPQSTEEDTNPWEDESAVALFMAIFYHGMASLASTAIPARIETVMTTADKFEHHLFGRR